MSAERVFPMAFRVVGAHVLTSCGVCGTLASVVLTVVDIDGDRSPRCPRCGGKADVQLGSVYALIGVGP